MDDLAGIDWSSKPSGTQPKPPPMNPTFGSLRPTPSPFASGRTTPLSAQPLSAQPSSGSGAKPLPQKAAADSFSNLVNFGPAKSSQKLSLAERQAQLEAEKRKQAEEQKRQVEAQFGNGQFWDNLGSRNANGSPASLQPPTTAPASKDDDDDLFAAFNKDTKVDTSSHLPAPEQKPSTPANSGQLDLSNPSAWGAVSGNNGSSFPEEDDDPFGLSEMKSSQPTVSTPQPQIQDDDDFLGDLGRPVEEVRRKQEKQPVPGRPIEDEGDSSSSSEAPAPPRRQTQKKGNDPFDHAVAQLVDYGFSADDARRALTESGAGTNVEAAVNWLLDEAHRKSKAATAGRSSSAGSQQQPQRRDNRSPAQGEQPDLAKSAAAVGNSLFKTANSLWKTGQKRMQQTLADFQQEGDPNQPKWMRDAQMGEQKRARRPDANVTDEAMMLEAGGRPQPTRTNSRPGPGEGSASPRAAQSQSSRSSPIPRQHQQSAPPARDPRSRLNRLAGDDDISTYSSPNRRRKATTPQAESKPAAPEPDLLFGDEAPRSRQTLPERPAAASAPPSATPPISKRPSPAPKPAPRPSRQIPNISAIALQNSTKLRHEGTTHFKRGDYASAHASYSSSLTGVPDTHPLAIVLLTNRALTALKTGEPKQAVNDADAALKIIGPGNGQGETVAVKGENGQDEQRDMKDLYGKALSRKAEALEQMEKWSDALSVWQLCVEGGVGGATAVKGRQRCQTALAPKPSPAAKAAAAAVKARPRPRPAATTQKSSEAVTRLREANQAAAKEDDEKFELSEKVDARVGAWRDGKRDNLRALLGSMDKVLWEGSGWKNIGMAELVMANKVKIQYMKAIAKVHPDKLPQDADTEKRLIAGLVFSTLNESWDKFKAENGL
ncbi:UBA domain-containing protein 7 [Sarocladium implicatum]|nr:UBA domain-containing protein 7 [Sarocladium implicatum]